MPNIIFAIIEAVLDAPLITYIDRRQLFRYLIILGATPGGKKITGLGKQ